MGSRSRHVVDRTLGNVRFLSQSILRRKREVTPESLVMDPPEEDLVAAIQPYTMTSSAAILAVLDSVRYVTRHHIPGAIVECGVWRGGSMMAAAHGLMESQDLRDLFLFDTFAGMPEPTGADLDPSGTRASELLARDRTRTTHIWALAELDEVRRNLFTTGYPTDRIHFVPGRIERTLTVTTPSPIALLRVDVDWYEGTRSALENLIPVVSPGGVLIFDDYGYWSGARKAIDEYIESSGLPLLLTRIDENVRLAVMPAERPTQQE